MITVNNIVAIITDADLQYVIDVANSILEEVGECKMQYSTVYNAHTRDVEHSIVLYR